MAEADGTIRIATSIDIKELQSQLNQMKSEIKQTSENSKKDLAQIAVQFAAVAAAAAVLVKTAQKVGETIDAYAQKTDRIDKMSQSLGLTRDTFQELDYAFAQNGASLDNFGMGMKSLQELTAKAATGATTAFDKLGVSIKDSSGNIKSQDEILKETLSAFNKMEQGVEKSTLATDVFGRSAQELMPVLNQESGTIDNLRKRAHDLGAVIKSEDVDAGVKFGDTVSDLKIALGSLANKSVAPLITMLTDITGALINCVTWLNSGSAAAITVKAVIIAFTVAVGGLVAVFLVLPAAISAVSAAVDVLTAAMAANPVGAIVVGITAVVAALATVAVSMNTSAGAANKLETATTALKDAEDQYKQIQEQLKNKTQDMTAAERDLLKSRRDLLAIDMQKQIQEMSKAYQGNIDTITKQKASLKLVEDEIKRVNKNSEDYRKSLEGSGLSQQKINEYVAQYKADNLGELMQEQTKRAGALAKSENAMAESTNAVAQAAADGVIDIEYLKTTNYKLYSAIMLQVSAIRQHRLEAKKDNDENVTSADKLAKLQDAIKAVDDERTQGAKKVKDGFETQADANKDLLSTLGQSVNTLYSLGYTANSAGDEGQQALAKMLAEYKKLAAAINGPVDPTKSYLTETQKVGTAIKDLSKEVADGYITQESANASLLSTLGQSIDAMYALGYAANASGSEGDKALADMISKYKGLAKVVNESSSAVTDINLGKLFVDTFKKNLTGMKKGIASAMAPVINGMKSNTIYKKCTEVGSAVSEKIGEGISKAKNFVVKALFGVTSDAATDSAIKTALKVAGKGFALAIADGFSAVKEFLSKAWDAIDWMANLDLASAQESVTNFIAGIGDFFLNDMQNLPAFFDAAVDAAANMIDGLVSSLPTIKKNIIILLKKIAAYLKGDGFKTLIKNVLSIIVGIAEVILDNLGDIVEAVLEAVPMIILALADALPDIVKAIISAIPQIVVAVVKAIPAIIYALGVAFGNLCSAIFDLAVSAGDYIWQGIVSGFETAGDWLGTYIVNPIEDAFSAMGSWISNVFSTIGDTLAGILKAPINAIVAGINWCIDQINKIRIDNDFLHIHIGFSLGHVPYLAKGTDNWQGGEAIVGEKGPELVDLPEGSVVHPAAETASLLSGMSALTSGFMPSLAFASAGSSNNNLSLNISPTTVDVDGKTIARITWEHIDHMAANV